MKTMDKKDDTTHLHTDFEHKIWGFTVLTAPTLADISMSERRCRQRHINLIKGCRMKKTQTHRGFSLIEFKDGNDQACSLQKSSVEDMLWLGVNDPNPQILVRGEGWRAYPIPDEVSINTRMHLTREQAEALLPYLQKFVETGEI